MKVLTIGRSSDNNNIVINDAKVSRSHLQIVKDDNGNYFAIDLESTNGTFVNGKHISGKVPLQKGDVVIIGNTTLPWETYFVDKSNPTSSNSSVVNKKSNKRKKSVIIGIMLLMCVCGGVIYVISYNNKKLEEKKILEMNYKDAQIDAALADANYNENERIKAEENEQKARDAEAIAKENEQKARDAETIARENEQKARDAETIARENEQKARDAEQLAKENEQKAKEAETLAKENEQKAKNELDATKKSLELTKEFYELLPEITGVVHGYRMKNVCDKLGLNVKTEEKLKSVFDKRDNEGKEKIIKIIKAEIGSNKTESSQTSGSQVTPQGNTTSTSNVPSGTANGNTTTTETNA